MQIILSQQKISWYQPTWSKPFFQRLQPCLVETDEDAPTDVCIKLVLKLSALSLCSALLLYTISLCVPMLYTEKIFVSIQAMINCLLRVFMEILCLKWSVFFLIFAIAKTTSFIRNLQFHCSTDISQVYLEYSGTDCMCECECDSAWCLTCAS